MGGKYSSMDPMDINVPELKAMLERDVYLKPYEKEIRRRYACYKDYVEKVTEHEGELENFTEGYKYYGFHVNEDNSVTAREWAPGAEQLYLTGDFNGWNRQSYPFTRLPYGKWEIHVPARTDGSCPINHLSQIKIVVKQKDGCLVDRLSPWAVFVVAPPKNEGLTYRQLMWNPPPIQRYHFKNEKVKRPLSLRIYECHVGIATQDPKIGSYREFIQNVIPRIKRQGYNAIQLMAIMEHAYYASFGYQVTSFFAASRTISNITHMEGEEDNNAEDSTPSTAGSSGAKRPKKSKSPVEAICDVLNQSVKQRENIEKKTGMKWKQN